MTFIQFINIFIALLVLTNPLIALPVVLSVARNQTNAQKLHTAILAAIAACVILLVMTWGGGGLLNILGIKIPAFEVAGGTVILLIAFSMLNAKISTVQHSKEDEKVSGSGIIIPLAFPIIAGPGAISSVILNAAKFPGLENRLLLSLACVLIALNAGIVLYCARYLEKILGHAGLNIFSRVGGLILMAIAFQILSNGIKGLML